MSAKEMFEELGYECTKNDHLWIVYICKSKWNKRFYYTIEFNLKFQKLKVYRYRSHLIRKIFSNEDMIGFYPSDIKAINKQVEELGWNNER